MRINDEWLIFINSTSIMEMTKYFSSSRGLLIYDNWAALGGASLLLLNGEEMRIENKNRTAKFSPSSNNIFKKKEPPADSRAIILRLRFKNVFQLASSA